jgi:hypothetical protein
MFYHSRTRKKVRHPSHHSKSQEASGHKQDKKYLIVAHIADDMFNDIKPCNILFFEEPGAVLYDFGLSCQLALSRLTAGGTPFYVPSEYITIE